MSKKTKAAQRKQASRKQASQKRARLVAAGLAGRRGPVGAVTMPVVERVGERMAKGLPLHYALALEDEDISEDAFHKALQKDEKLSTHLTRFKAKYIYAAVEVLSAGDTADIKWLLARRHPEYFGEKPENPEGPAVEAGLQELLNKSRELARLKAHGGNE